MVVKILHYFGYVHLYVYRLCINFQELCVSLLEDILPFFMLLPFISCFMIDFLFIEKVKFFSAIATDDRHSLRPRSIYQNASFCLAIHFRYIAQPGGGGGGEVYLLRMCTY